MNAKITSFLLSQFGVLFLHSSEIAFNKSNPYLVSDNTSWRFEMDLADAENSIYHLLYRLGMEFSLIFFNWFHWKTDEVRIFYHKQKKSGNQKIYCHGKMHLVWTMPFPKQVSDKRKFTRIFWRINVFVFDQSLDCLTMRLFSCVRLHCMPYHWKLVRLVTWFLWHVIWNWHPIKRGFWPELHFVV